MIALSISPPKTRIHPLEKGGKAEVQRSEELAVEGAVLDGFGDVGDLDVIAAAEIGDSAGDFEQTFAGAGEAKL